VQRSYDLILFDMDGTLYPNDLRLRRVYLQAALNLIERHYGVDRATAEAEFSAHRDELSARLNGRPANTLVLLTYYDRVEFQDMADEVNALHPAEAVLAPDPLSVAAVAAVVRAWPTMLYTMNNAETARRILDAIGMAHLFPVERRVTLDTMAALPLSRAERLAHVKPGLDGYRWVLHRWGVEPERALMVGDSQTSDLEPAASLGMATYLVRQARDLHALPGWLSERRPG